MNWVKSIKKYLKNLNRIRQVQKITRAGEYVTKSGKTVYITQKPSIEPIDISKLGKNIYGNTGTRFTVDDIDTVSCAIKKFKDKHPLILNFANAINPGGGVYYGSSTQEESLCRASTLLNTLESREAYDEYYSINKHDRNTLGLNCFPRALLIRDVTIFTDNDGNFLEKPEIVDVLTIAAPYQLNDEVYRHHNIDISDIIMAIVSIISDYDYEYAILGAIGCGAFHQDPNEVAKLFRNHFDRIGCTASKVSFAIPTSTIYNYASFASKF